MLKDWIPSVGDLKVSLHQSAFLISLCNLGMVGYLFVDRRGWDWWYFLLPVFIVTYNVFYFKYLRSREMSSNWNASPPMMKLTRDCEEILKRVKRIESRS
jgi:hypothetical protein